MTHLADSQFDFVQTSRRLSPGARSATWVVVALCCASTCGCAGWRQNTTSAKSIDPSLAVGANDLDQGQTAELCLTAAQQFERGGRYAEAAAQYERVLQNRPESPGVQHRLAVLYDRLEEHERASRSFQKALAESPQDGRLWNDYGFYHYQRGRWQDAEQAYRKSCQLTPTMERNRVNLGLALAQQGRLEDAYTEFTRVLSPAAAHSNLGMVLAQQGRGAEADSAFERALACEPGLPQPRAGRQLLNDVPGASDRATPASYHAPTPTAP